MKKKRKEHVRVEIRKGRNGKFRTNWYGVYEINGQRYCVNLGIEIKGTPPASLRETGDLVFEMTRAKAEEKLTNIVKEAKSTKNSQYLLEKIYEQRTGSLVPEVKLSELVSAWKNIPRARSLSKGYISSCAATLHRFVDFIGSINSKILCLSEVTANLFDEFLRREESRGISAKTYNDIIKLLRTAWSKLLPGFCNPLANIPPKQSTTCFRKPFSEQITLFIQ